MILIAYLACSLRFMDAQLVSLMEDEWTRVYIANLYGGRWIEKFLHK